MLVDLEKKLEKLPDTPGIYYFKTAKKILYIGKATSLRSRVRSYFRSDLPENRGPWVAQMIERADRIDFTPTDSVLEALILESAQIKKHQPPYNTREKDDKSYLYVILTKEDFPRLLTIRGKDLSNPHDFVIAELFGPFPYGAELREALKIIRKIFPYRDKCAPPKPGQTGKLCFNAQLGLCPGICGGNVSQTEYGRTVRHLKLFFRGQKGKLVKQLEREMHAAARDQKFELAQRLKNQIFSLNHIRDVALIKHKTTPSLSSPFRLESYDIAHLSGQQTVGVMAVLEDGELKKNDYRRFLLRGASAHKADDTGNLREVLERRFRHQEWPLPNLLVVDGGEAQRHVAQNVLAQLNLNLPVAAVVKDERHRARAVLGPPELVAKHHDEIIHLNQDTHRYAIRYHRLRRKKDSQF